MKNKRKVRKDFDKAQNYSVDVSGCTEEVKKEVQQAFFDVGFNWLSDVGSYKYLDAGVGQYSNTYEDGEVATHLMQGTETTGVNMTAQEFLNLVYEDDMKNKRKVHKDFDPKQSISVDVSGCTEEEKKEVQQAFFDVGLFWSGDSKTPSNMGANYYTNTMLDGTVDNRLLFGDRAVLGVMSPSQFLAMVYEPEQQGHIHADLMAQYAEDAKTTDKPWELWQIKVNLTDGHKWVSLNSGFHFNDGREYRRKPKTHIVHGVEIPDLRVTPELGEYYYLVDPTVLELAELHTFMMKMEKLWFERGLAYQHTEEGKKAAILHGKAMLGIV